MGVSQYFLWSVALGLLKPQFHTPPFVFQIWVVLEDFAQKEQIVFCSLIENCSLICHRAIVSIQLLTLFFSRCGRYSADCIMTIQCILSKFSPREWLNCIYSQRASQKMWNESMAVLHSVMWWRVYVSLCLVLKHGFPVNEVRETYQHKEV